MKPFFESGILLKICFHARDFLYDLYLVFLGKIFATNCLAQFIFRLEDMIFKFQNIELSVYNWGGWTWVIEVSLC